MLYFLDSGMYMGHDSIRVRIRHKMEEGYPLSADGHEINEELPLPEFLRRIFPDKKHFEIEMYRISKAMSYGRHSAKNEELDQCADVYNKMYIKLFRDRKTVLAQHTMRGIGQFGVDPYMQRQADMAQRSASDYHREQMLREVAYPHSPSRGLLDTGPSKRELIEIEEKKLKKKRDDDLFFLTT